MGFPVCCHYLADIKDPTMSFAKSGRAIASTTNTLQIPALTSRGANEEKRAFFSKRNIYSEKQLLLNIKKEFPMSGSDSGSSASAGDVHSATCQFCDREPPQFAVKTCTTCSASYCSECLSTTHPKKPPFSAHHMVELGGTGTRRFQYGENVRDKTPSAQLLDDQKVSSHIDIIIINIIINLSLQSALGHLLRSNCEIELLLARLLQIKQQVEVTINASMQEKKLEEECDKLLEIIQERKQLIRTKIRDGKTSRLRRLAEQVGECRRGLEQTRSLASKAEESLSESEPSHLLQNTRELTERYVWFFSTRVSGVVLIFLTKLLFFSAPNTPIIRPSLCIASHDAISVRWSSDDAFNVRSYELQYAIYTGNTNLITLCSSADSWLIVPNVRRCEYTVHGLQSGTRYLFLVRAINQAGSRSSPCATLKTHSQPFKLDAESAHKKLRISHNELSVHGGEGPTRRLHGSRGNYAVAGNLLLDSGRHYWEVHIHNCTWWVFAVGIANTSTPRQAWLGGTSVAWSLCRVRGGSCIIRGNGADVPLGQRPSLRWLGLMLDYDGGSLSFYDAAVKRCIFSLAVVFSQPLLPTFALWDGEMSVLTGLPIPDYIDQRESVPD
uniref:Midline 1 n=1 Tax=Eptatretus burgeri TaxID=7764 RepID=A0A8C4NFH6_EPTBU